MELLIVFIFALFIAYIIWNETNKKKTKENFLKRLDVLHEQHKNSEKMLLDSLKKEKENSMFAYKYSLSVEEMLTKQVDALRLRCLKLEEDCQKTREDLSELEIYTEENIMGVLGSISSLQELHETNRKNIQIIKTTVDKLKKHITV